MSKAKLFIQDALPPMLWRQLLRCRGHAISMDGNYASWQDASAQCSGYEKHLILDKVLAATLAVKQGEAIFERDSVLFHKAEYSWPVLAGLMWVAAKNQGQLNVLDFGGALGSSYFQNRNFLLNLPHVSWSVVEQPHFVAAGQQRIQDQILRFYLSIEDCLAQQQPNVVLLSSVLQYLQFPWQILEQVLSSKVSTVIIDRTPFSAYMEDKLVIQKVPPIVYEASYPMWILSEQKLNGLMSSNWHLMSTYISPEGKKKNKHGLHFTFQGMIFERKG